MFGSTMYIKQVVGHSSETQLSDHLDKKQCYARIIDNACCPSDDTYE